MASTETNIATTGEKEQLSIKRNDKLINLQV
jgi:hypothetical protein